MKSILFIGDLPPPITGMRLANSVVYKRLSTSTKVLFLGKKAVTRGYFSRRSLVGLVRELGSMIRAVFVICYFRVDSAYCAVSQSRAGFLRNAVLLILLSSRTRIVLHFHGSLITKSYTEGSRIEKFIMRLVLQKAAVCIVLGDYLRDSAPFNLPDISTVVVRNFGCVDEDLPRRRIQNQAIRNNIRVLFLGNLLPEKGIFELLECCNILFQSGYRIELDVAGDIFSPEVKVAFSKILEKRIGWLHYHGVVTGKEKIKLLGDADVFALPTYYDQEGLPISLIEAMSAGCYVVTTKRGAIPEIVDDRGGEFVAERSVDALVKALARLFRDPSRLRSAATFNAEAVRGFTETAFAEAVFELVLDKSGAISYSSGG